MKRTLRLLVAVLTISLALVFAASGHSAKTLIGLFAKTAGPSLSFEDYSKMDSKSDRAAAFAKETPHNKSLLWKQHLAYYEAKLNLNDQQKEFLKRVSALLDESFFATPINMSEAEYLKSARGKPFKELMQNASKLFTPEQSRQLFLTLGDVSTITDWGCGASQPAVSEAEPGEGSGPNYSEPNNANAFETCTCTGSICGSGCGSGTTCKIGFPGPLCQEGGACGCFDLFNCTGLCFQDGEIQ